MKKKFKLIYMIIISIIIVSGTACGRKNTVSKPEDSFSGRITVLTDPRYEQALNVAVENFKKIHPKVDIVLKSENNININSSNRLKDKSNRIDIINLENMYIQSFIDKNKEEISDITNDIEPYKYRILKNKIENVAIKNKIYGFPWSSSPKIMVYKKDTFSKEGINPEDIKTWSDFIEAGRKISKDTGKKIIPNINNDYNDIRFILPNQLGLSFISKEGKMDFSSSSWIRNGEMIKALYADNIFFDVEGEESIIDLAISENITCFIADPKIITNFTAVIKEGKGNWGVMKLPAFEPGGNRDASLGGSSFMVNKNSTNQSLAKEFIKFAAIDEKTIVEYTNKTGIFPTFMDIYDLKDFNKNDEYFNNKVLFMFSSSDKGAYTVNYTKNFSDIRDLYKNALNSEALKSKDIKGEMDLLQKECIKKLNDVH